MLDKAVEGDSVVFKSLVPLKRGDFIIFEPGGELVTKEVKAKVFWFDELFRNSDILCTARIGTNPSHCKVTHLSDGFDPGNPSGNSDVSSKYFFVSDVVIFFDEDIFVDTSHMGITNFVVLEVDGLQIAGGVLI